MPQLLTGTSQLCRLLGFGRLLPVLFVGASVPDRVHNFLKPSELSKQA